MPRVGPVKARGRQRTDSAHVLAAVRALNRLELVRETPRHVLDVLAVAAPDWLHGHAAAEWVARSGRRWDEERRPKGKEAQRELAERVGADGIALLSAIDAAGAPPRPRAAPAVETLRRVWVQNELQTEAGVRWRTGEDGRPRAARFPSLPHDPDARLGKKGSTCWVGYKVALTETLEDDLPNPVTHVETTAAPTADGEVTPKAHAALQTKGLLPAVRLVDTGFLDPELLVTSRRDYGVALLGPTRPDVTWQARAGKRSTCRDSPATGSGRPARAARPASVGRRRSTSAPAASSRSRSPAPTAAPGRAVIAACARRMSSPGGRSRLARARSTRRSGPDEPRRRRRPTPPRTAGGPASRAPSRGAPPVRPAAVALRRAPQGPPRPCLDGRRHRRAASRRQARRRAACNDAAVAVRRPAAPAVTNCPPVSL